MKEKAKEAEESGLWKGATLPNIRRLKLKWLSNYQSSEITETELQPIYSNGFT